MGLVRARTGGDGLRRDDGRLRLGRVPALVDQQRLGLRRDLPGPLNFPCPRLSPPCSSRHSVLASTTIAPAGPVPGLSLAAFSKSLLALASGHAPSSNMLT